MIASSNQRPNMMRQSSVKYRYSCEEMLNYYTRDNCYPPKDLVEHEEVYIDKVQDPLLFTEPSIEEINLLSQSINSECIMHKQKSTKENGEGGNIGVPDRAADFLRERTEERENRAIKLLNSSEMTLRKPPGMGGITPSSALASGGGGFAGMFSSDRSSGGVSGGGGNTLRPGRGGANVVASSDRGSSSSARGGLSRGNASSLFSRVASYDESASTGSSFRSNSVTSATLLSSKKGLGSGGGLQRSTTTDNSSSNNNVASSISNSFVPAWRTSNSLTSGSSTANATSTTASNAGATTTSVAAANSSNATNTTTNPLSEQQKTAESTWRSNSDVSKNWRLGDGVSTGGGKPISKPTSAKDFFGGDVGEEQGGNSASWDIQGREYGFQRSKRGGLNSVTSQKATSTKPGNFISRNRFDAESNDLFGGKTKSGGNAFDDFEGTFGGGGDDRDLFGENLLFFVFTSLLKLYF